MKKRISTKTPSFRPGAYSSPVCCVRTLSSRGPLAVSGVQGEDMIVINPDFNYD